MDILSLYKMYFICISEEFVIRIPFMFSLNIFLFAKYNK
jgi:hypothetical protein